MIHLSENSYDSTVLVTVIVAVVLIAVIITLIICYCCRSDPEAAKDEAADKEEKDEKAKMGE